MAAATESLWFNADKSKLVAEGDPDARSLAAAVGDEIPDGFAAPKAKQAAKAADKAVGKADNK